MDLAGDDLERTIITHETTEGDRHTSTCTTKNGRGRVLEIRRETRVANVLRQLVETFYNYRGMLAIETENTYRPDAEGTLVLAHTRTTEGVFTQDGRSGYTGSTSMGIGRGYGLPRSFPHTPSWGVPGIEGDTDPLPAFPSLDDESVRAIGEAMARHPRPPSWLERLAAIAFGTNPRRDSPAGPSPTAPRPPSPAGERPVNPDLLVKSSRPSRPLPKRKIVTD